MAQISPVPLGQILSSDILPLDKFEAMEGLEQFLMRIFIVEYTESLLPKGKKIEVGLSIAKDAILAMPGLNGISLVLGGLGAAMVKAVLELSSDTWSVTLMAGVRLRFSREWLRSVRRDQGVWVDDDARKHVELTLAGGIRIDHNWAVSIAGTNEFKFGPAMIADTGFVLDGTLVLDLSETSGIPESRAMGLDVTWRGAVFKSLSLHLPDDMDVPIAPDELVLTNFYISSGGLSGSIQGDWSPQIVGQNISGSGSGKLFGMPFGLKSIRLSLVQGAITDVKIKGLLGLTFFKGVTHVDLGFDLDGNLSVRLDLVADNSELPLSSAGINFARLKLSSLGFELSQGMQTVLLSGSIQPLIGAPQLQWPEFGVQKLSVDSQGNTQCATY